MFNRRNTGLGVIALLWIFSTNAYSDSNIAVIPSIALLEKNIDFKQSQSGPLSSLHGNFSADIPMLDLSLTAGLNKWFLTLKYDFALTDTTVKTSENSIRTGSGSDQYFWQPPGTLMQVGRDDKNITLGYSVTSNGNFFVGYMQGETNIEPPPTCENPVVQPGGPGPLGTSIYCQSYNFSWLRLRQNNTISPTSPLAKYTQTYTEEGPFVGFSYAMNIHDAGALSFSAAYADMRGRFKDNIQVFGLQGFDASGDVSGTSVALTWTQPLGESSSYFIDLRQQSYKMTALDNQTQQQFKTKEVMSSLALGLQLYF